MDVSLNRLYRQHLVGRPLATAEEVVGWLGAVQSQDFGGAKWGVAQRVAGLTDEDVTKAYNDGRILRTHILRPTWHFVLPADIRWMLELTAPRINALSAYYFRKSELDDQLFARTNKLIVDALSGGNYLTRPELQTIFTQNGIESDGLRLGYIVIRAELDAIVCNGPMRGKQFTYALMDERAPATKPKTRDEALVELVTRYFQSHGPAMAQDFSNWSSLSVTDAKRGLNLLGPAIDRIEVDGKTYWYMDGPKSAKLKGSIIHLLPNYDEYLIAYKDYLPVFDQPVLEQVRLNEEFVKGHILVRNGKVIGGWSRTLTKKEAVISLKLLVDLDDEDRVALQNAIEKYAAFLGVPVRLA